MDRSTSYPEVKTILKDKQHCKWRHKHPRYNKADPYYLLTRREQVTVFRLRTGHSRLNYHLYSKLRNGHTEQCPCGTGSQTSAIQSSALAVLVVRHRPYRAVPLRYWQSDNRTSTAVLPHQRDTQKRNLARPHSRCPQAVRKPEGLVMHCHLQ